MARFSGSAPVEPGPHEQSSFINIVWGTVRGITEAAWKQDTVKGQVSQIIHI